VAGIGASRKPIRVVSAGAPSIVYRPPYPPRSGLVLLRKSKRMDLLRHSRSMHLYRSGMPMVLLAEWLGHAQPSSNLIYANADTEMKREVIEKATSKLNSLVSVDTAYFQWEDDEALLRQLHGLS